MIKIFAVGDFHAKFPEKLKKIIKKERPDFILSDGDYAGIDDFRPYFKKMFKENARGNKVSLEEVMGEERYEKALKKDYVAGKIPLRELNKFKIKIFSVFGNLDWYNWEFGEKQRDYAKTIKKMKNIKEINRGIGRFNGLKIVGFGGYIDNDIYFTAKGKRAISADSESTKRRRKRYKKEEKRFMNLMKIKPDIVLSHYTPYKCLDKMKEKGFALTGSNMGVSFYNRGMKRYSPALFVCGHMHENQGKCLVGKTHVINPGAAVEGKAAIILFDEKKKRVLSVRFVK